MELHNPQSPKRDKYASKFTYALNDYNYSWTKSKEGIVITLNAKKGVDSSVKHAKVVLNPKNYYPVSLHIKVAFFWTRFTSPTSRLEISAIGCLTILLHDLRIITLRTAGPISK